MKIGSLVDVATSDRLPLKKACTWKTFRGQSVYVGQRTEDRGQRTFRGQSVYVGQRTEDRGHSEDNQYT